MDGDQAPDIHGEMLRERGSRARTQPPRTGRWLIIVGLLLVLVLGALYGFNRFREHAIANFFAHHKSPPVTVTAVVAKSEAVPRHAGGIGSLAAVHEVTVTPEVGGRVTAILFKPGTTVKAGQPLVQLNDAPDRGDLANFEAQAHLAELQLQRATALRRNSFASQQTVDQAKAQLEQMNAEIAKTKAIIAQKLIRAPFAGRLGLRRVDLGQYLTAGAPIVSLTDLSLLYVNFTLPTQRRAEIHVGQQVEVTADAFPGRTFTAQITTIEPQVSPETRTIQVQATMHNRGDALLPGMFVNAAVVLPQQRGVVVLPATAVDYTLYGDSVYVVKDKGHGADGKPILEAVRTPVKTGTRWGDNVAILSGVTAGERVVAVGQLKLQNGAQVALSSVPAPQPPAHPTLH